MDLGIWTYVKLLMASAVVSACINVGYNIVRDRRERDTERTFGALEAALVLERYTRVCANKVLDCSAAEDEAVRIHSYEPLRGLSLPKFEFPDTVVWKWLKPDLAARLQDFPTAYEATRRHLFVDQDWNDDPFSHVAEISLSCARMGRDAWELALFVRTTHGLPEPATHEHDSHIQDVIKARLDLHAKLLAERKADQEHEQPNGALS